MKVRGDGRVFQQKGSPFLWIAYYNRGQEFRESTKQPDLKAAERMLRSRLKEVGADQQGLRRFIGPAAERVYMEQLFDGLETVKKNNNRKTPSEMPRLRAYWNRVRAMDVNGKKVEDWKSKLLDEKLSPKTIRNYLQLLNEAFQIAVRNEVLAYAPHIPQIEVPENSRNGSFTRAEFLKVVELLPTYLRDFCEWAYYTGWRAGSIRSLRWADVRGDVLTVRPQYAKNRKTQDIPLVGPLAAIIERRRADRDGEFVFHYPKNNPLKGDHGQPIGSYKTAWKNAMTKAGLTGRMFHDFRRTAATELRRAGVPEEVAMKITGHVTNTMFKRYRIVDTGDVSRAIEQRAAYEAAQLAAIPTSNAVN